MPDKLSAHFKGKKRPNNRLHPTRLRLPNSWVAGEKGSDDGRESRRSRRCRCPLWDAHPSGMLREGRCREAKPLA